MGRIYSDGSLLLQALNAAADRRAAYNKSVADSVSNIIGSLADWGSGRLNAGNALDMALAGAAQGTDEEEQSKMKADPKYGKYADDPEMFELWKAANGGDAPLGTKEELKAEWDSMDNDLFAETMAARKAERQKQAEEAREKLGASAAARDETLRKEGREDSIRKEERDYAAAQAKEAAEQQKTQAMFGELLKAYGVLRSNVPGPEASYETRAKWNEDAANVDESLAKFVDEHPDYAWVTSVTGKLAQDGGQGEAKESGREVFLLSGMNPAELEKEFDRTMANVRANNGQFTLGDLDKVGDIFQTMYSKKAEPTKEMFDTFNGLMANKLNDSIPPGEYHEYLKYNPAINAAYERAVKREAAAEAAEQAARAEKEAARVAAVGDAVRDLVTYAGKRSPHLNNLPATGRQLKADLKELRKTGALDNGMIKSLLNKMGYGSSHDLDRIGDNVNPRKLIEMWENANLQQGAGHGE